MNSYCIRVKPTYLQDRDQLGESCDEEKEVEEESELVVEHYWDEGEHRVLLVIQLVPKEATRYRSAGEPHRAFLNGYNKREELTSLDLTRFKNLVTLYPQLRTSSYNIAMNLMASILRILLWLILFLPSP